MVTNLRQAPHRVKFCAGAACVAFFWLLPLVGAPVLVCLLSLVAVVMAMFWNEDSKAVATNRFYAGSLAAFTLLVAFVPSIMQFMCVDYKEMGEMMNVQRDANTRIESTTWTPLCRVDVVTNYTAQLIGSASKIDTSRTPNSVSPAIMVPRRITTATPGG